MRFFKKGFTLLEMLIVVVILGIVFTVVIQSYYKLIRTKTDIYIRGILTKNTNSLVEKVNLIMKNYTIDYEEYFNRRILGCDGNGGNNFSWNVGENGYCDKFTAYGNGNSLDTTNAGNNILYYCSSVASDGTQKETPGSATDCEGNNNTGTDYIYSEKTSGGLSSGDGCWESLGNNNIQSFGEYALQFWDVNKNADGNWGCKGDDDDTDLGKGPVAVANNTGVKELYLISKDGKKRVFLRRKLVFSGDLNNDGNISNWEKLYKIQILKLRGFDLGTGHDGKGKFAYDGKIDTWACDKLAGFVCNGQSLESLGYTGYNLPSNINDGWQDFNIIDLSIEDLSFIIYPIKSPFYAWQDDNYQISPYIKMSLKTRFYGINYMKKINPESLSGYRMRINTTFATKEY